MKSFIGNFVTEAASRAMSGIGPCQAALAARHGGCPSPKLIIVGAPIILALMIIRIEVTLKS